MDFIVQNCLDIEVKWKWAMCQNDIYYSVKVFVFYIHQSYASRNSWASGVSLMPSLHLTIPHKVFSLSQTFSHKESTPSSSGAGGGFAVSWEPLTLSDVLVLFQKFPLEFAKRVHFWISIFTSTTITTPQKTNTKTKKNKNNKQTEGHRELREVMAMSFAHGDGVQVFVYVQNHQLIHMKCVQFFLYQWLHNKALKKKRERLALTDHGASIQFILLGRDVWWGLWVGWVLGIL